MFRFYKFGYRPGGLLKITLIGKNNHNANKSIPAKTLILIIAVVLHQQGIWLFQC